MALAVTKRDSQMSNRGVIKIVTDINNILSIQNVMEHHKYPKLGELFLIVSGDFPSVLFPCE